MTHVSDEPNETVVGTTRLVAYRLSHTPPLRLVPAGRERDWINQTSRQFARRCLPLMLANQSGWFILNSHRLTTMWNGGSGTGAITFEWESGIPPYPASSHFGHGILTWHIPYLFRTSPGWNLLARGPANWPKHGVCALEGLVETDWAVATFTMNWRFTQPGLPVTWDIGEPICMLVPQRRGELEAIEPELREITADPALAEAFATWKQSRQGFLEDLRRPDSAAVKAGWQRDYFRGRAPNGVESKQHQTKLRLSPFAEPNGSTPFSE